MSQLNIVAILTIKPEFSAEFKTEFKKIVEASRQEAGCIKYELNQDVIDPYTYVFSETWQSQQAIDEHNNQAHFKHFGQFAADKLAARVVHVMKKLI